jgi:hypothetical protein
LPACITPWQFRTNRSDVMVSGQRQGEEILLAG